MRYPELFQLALRVVASIDQSLRLSQPRQRLLAEQVMLALAAENGITLSLDLLHTLVQDAEREYRRRPGWRLHRGLRWLARARCRASGNRWSADRSVL